MTLEVNIGILSGVEELFLSQDNSPEQKEIKDPFVLDSLRSNVSRVGNEWGLDAKINRLIKRLDKIVRDYSGKKEDEAQNSRNIFNKVIKELGLYNSSFFADGSVPIPERERGDKTQVFLSHAYDDRLYALALFEYFYKFGIYLYVDWMHRGKAKDGYKLKKDLERELDLSDQLLFLRTLNSELDIQGKHILRPWCAWELGNFFRKERDQKYLLNLYSVESYKNSYNLQLHGLKLYTGVHNGFLTGTTIVP